MRLGVRGREQRPEERFFFSTSMLYGCGRFSKAGRCSAGSRAGRGRDERSAFLTPCRPGGWGWAGKDEKHPDPRLPSIPNCCRGGLGRLLVRRARRRERRADVPKVHAELVEFLGHRTRSVPEHGGSQLPVSLL